MMWKKNKYIKISVFKTCLALSQEQIWTLAEVICMKQLKNDSFRMVFAFLIFQVKDIAKFNKTKIEQSTVLKSFKFY